MTVCFVFAMYHWHLFGSIFLRLLLHIPVTWQIQSICLSLYFVSFYQNLPRIWLDYSLWPVLCCTNPLTLTLYHTGTAIKHPVPDRVKPPFVIFDIRALSRSSWASECPDVKNYKWRLNSVWYRVLYSCTRMAIVGIKGLAYLSVCVFPMIRDVITVLINKKAVL